MYLISNLFSHISPLPSALLSLGEKELASQVQKIITSCGKIKNDRSKIPFLEQYIYICGLKAVMKIIQLYGLFPAPSTNMEQMAPKLHVAWEYMCSNNKDKKQDFIQILEVMINKVKASTHAGRGFVATAFAPEAHRMSILPFFNLSFIYHIKTTALNPATFPLLKLGKFNGAETYNLQSPFDNNHLISGTTVHKINKFGDLLLRTNNDLQPLALWERTIMAHFVFHWAERRLWQSKQADNLKASLTIWNMDRQDQPVLSVDMTFTTPKKKRGKTPTRNEGSTQRRHVDASLDKDQLLEGLCAVASEIIKLKGKFPTKASKKLSDQFQTVTDSFLHMMLDNQLGHHKSLDNFVHSSNSSLLDPVPAESVVNKNAIVSYLTNSESKVLGTLKDNSTGLLKNAMGWINNPNIDISDATLNNHFIMFQTNDFQTIFDTYHGGIATKPDSPIAKLVDEIKTWKEGGWSSNLLHVVAESSGSIQILAIFTSAIFNDITERLFGGNSSSSDSETAGLLARNLKRKTGPDDEALKQAKRRKVAKTLSLSSDSDSNSDDASE